MAIKQVDPPPDDALTREVGAAVVALDQSGKREVLAFSRRLL